MKNSKLFGNVCFFALFRANEVGRSAETPCLNVHASHCVNIIMLPLGGLTFDCGAQNWLKYNSFFLVCGLTRRL